MVDRITSAKLTQLTDGSDCDSLHTHTILGGGSSAKAGTAVTGATGEAIVMFRTAFLDANYSISLTALDLADTATCMYSNKTNIGFGIKVEDDGGKDEPDVAVDWVATPFADP